MSLIMMVERAMGTQPVTRDFGSVGIALVGRKTAQLGGSGDVGARLARLELENTSVDATTGSRRCKGVVD